MPRSKANFFAPRRTRQRDNNDNNERRQIDDNTNEINVHNSAIDELHPPPVFTNNYSVFVEDQMTLLWVQKTLLQLILNFA